MQIISFVSVIQYGCWSRVWKRSIFSKFPCACAVFSHNTSERKHECKHKEKEKNWSLRLCLCLRLRQPRFHSEISALMLALVFTSVVTSLRWPPLHSFVFMLIRNTALVLKQNFFWNLLVVARLERLITIETEEYFIWPHLVYYRIYYREGDGKCLPSFPTPLTISFLCLFELEGGKTIGHNGTSNALVLVSFL